MYNLDKPEATYSTRKSFDRRKTSTPIGGKLPSLNGVNDNTTVGSTTDDQKSDLTLQSRFREVKQQSMDLAANFDSKRGSLPNATAKVGHTLNPFKQAVIKKDCET